MKRIEQVIPDLEEYIGSRESGIFECQEIITDFLIKEGFDPDRILFNLEITRSSIKITPVNNYTDNLLTQLNIQHEEIDKFANP